MTSNPAMSHILHSIWLGHVGLQMARENRATVINWRELPEAEKELWSKIAAEFVGTVVRNMPPLEALQILRQKMADKLQTAVETDLEHTKQALVQIDQLYAFISTYLVPVPQEEGIL